MRLNYWADSLKIIKVYPWTGTGLGNFNLTYARYAHNSYLQIWAEMGILGIIAFLWLIITVLKSGLKNLYLDSESQLLPEFSISGKSYRKLNFGLSKKRLILK